MQPGSGLIENIQNAGIFLPSEMRGKFQALRFAAGKRSAGLAKTEISQANFFQHAQTRRNLRVRGEKRQSLAHRHLQNIVNVVFFVAHVEHGALVTCAAAFFANQFYVGEETHLDGYCAVTLASFAAAAGNIERKMSRRETALLGFRRGSENLADGVERL